MATIQINTAHNIEIEYELAGVGERILAGLIDLSIIVAYEILVFIFQVYISKLDSNGVLMILVFLLPASIYSLVSELLMHGQTVGKRVLKIKVISIVGETPSTGQYIIRWLFRVIDVWISTFSIAIIMIAATAKHQRIGDIVAGTTLVKTTSKASLTQTLYEQVTNPDYNVLYPDVIHLTDRDIHLIKEVVMNVRKSGNTMLALELMRKIEDMLNIKSNHEPLPFLYAVLNDYNHLARKL